MVTHSPRHLTVYDTCRWLQPCLPGGGRIELRSNPACYTRTAPAYPPCVSMCRPAEQPASDTRRDRREPNHETTSCFLRRDRESARSCRVRLYNDRYWHEQLPDADRSTDANRNAC